MKQVKLLLVLFISMMTATTTLAQAQKTTTSGKTVKTTKAKKVKDIIGYFHTIKPNKLEAEILSGIKINNENDLEKVAKKIKNEYGLLDYTNTEGTVCAYYLQEYEVRILETLYNYCIENNIIKKELLF